MAGKDSSDLHYCFSDNAYFYLFIICTDRKIQVCEHDCSGNDAGTVPWNYGVHVIYCNKERKWDSRSDDHFWNVLYDPFRHTSQEPVEYFSESL